MEHLNKFILRINKQPREWTDQDIEQYVAYVGELAANRELSYVNNSEKEPSSACALSL